MEALVMRHGLTDGEAICDVPPGKRIRVFAVHVLMIVVLMLLAGCATPIRTREVGVRRTYEAINVNALREDACSDATVDVLHRFSLHEQFQEAPNKVIEILHDKACEDERRDLLYALSELTYLTANEIQKGSRVPSEWARQYYLSSAIYAYFYLLGDLGEAPPSPYDRRFRVACDLYNTALAQALTIRREDGAFEDGVRQLPVGTIFLELRSAHFPYKLESFERLIPSDQLAVYGLTVRDRHPGLGAPFIAEEKISPGTPIAGTVPGTLFLRVEGGIRDLETGASRGLVELYSSYEEQEIDVDGKTVPLEDDLTAQLAYWLNQPFFWKVGRLQFLTGRQLLKSGVYSMQPYSPDRIPVVFVHGTVSSPAWWAEMFNTLRSDPVLRDKYEFWFYIYDSGKPIPFSAVEFREALTQKVKDLDSEAKDGFLRQMVIVGHSQGGLLTKLAAVETGDAIIRAVAKKGPEELDLSEAEQVTVRRYLIYTPLPFVTRVVFISTPHRGSYLARDWVVRLVKKIVSLPVNILAATADLVSAGNKMGLNRVGGVGDVRTSIDSMSPKNEGMLALAEIPLAPGIKGHSIIAIKGDEEPPEGDDGVVKYTSAHVDYVESEFLVRSGHSCQGDPLVIEEVRRILLEHLAGDLNSDTGR
jgi:pimeloyl-ACP methyl ester carboxylesterase